MQYMRVMGLILVMNMLTEAARNCTSIGLPTRQPTAGWLQAQVQFWYGDTYPLVMAKQWDRVHELIGRSSYRRHITSLLSFNDTSEQSIAKKYNNWASYRYKENADVLCDFLRHSPPGKLFTEEHRFPILLVDCVGPNEPIIGYVRSVNVGEENAILWPLEYHFNLGQRGLQDNFTFASKISKVLYRGVLSSSLHHVENYHHGLMKVSRLDVVLRWKNETWADMGITGYPDHLHQLLSEDAQLRDQVTHARKGHLRYEHQLTFRYILCVEGADVSSAFGWVLASKSVPIHPYPFMFRVWYFNGLLPWVHFVPIRPDASDLESVFIWCESNVASCERIAETGRTHMEMMLDDEFIDHVKANVVGLWDLRNL